MDDLPDAAITAAIEANDAFFANDDDLKFSWHDGSDVRELARRMLEAAAPAFRAQGAATERARIAAGMDDAARWAFADLLDGDDG